MLHRRDFLIRASLVATGFAGTMPARGVVVPEFEAEASRLFVELNQFRDEFLPVLTLPILVRWEKGSYRRSAWSDETKAARPTLAEWQAAVDRLSEAVLRRSGAMRAALDPDDFARLGQLHGDANENGSWTDLLTNPPYRRLSLADNGIRDWDLPIYWGWIGDRQARAAHVLKLMQGTESVAANPWDELRRREVDLKQWYLGQPATFGNRHNIAVLSVLAELDPVFVAAALDRRQMEARLQADERIPAKEKRLEQCLLRSPTYSSILCGTVAQLLPQVAANHFLAIERFLCLPEIHGDSFWKGVGTQGIFAVLFHKVAVLRELALGKQ